MRRVFFNFFFSRFFLRFAFLHDDCTSTLLYLEAKSAASRRRALLSSNFLCDGAKLFRRRLDEIQFSLSLSAVALHRDIYCSCDPIECVFTSSRAAVTIDGATVGNATVFKFQPNEWTIEVEAPTNTQCAKRVTVAQSQKVFLSCGFDSERQWNSMMRQV